MSDAGVPNMLAGRKITIVDHEAERIKAIREENKQEQPKIETKIETKKKPKEEKIQASHPLVHGSFEIAEEEI